MSHKKIQHITTTLVLELFHMDLMEPMKVESLRVKKYIFVCVDVYSRYTWFDFIPWKFWYLCFFMVCIISCIMKKGEEIGKIICIWVITVRNLITKTSLYFIILRGFIMSFLLPSHLSRMVLLRGLIIPYKKLLELWFMLNIFHNIFGKKQWIMLLIFTIE